MAWFLGKAERIESSSMNVVWSRRAVRHLISLRNFIAKNSERNASLVAGRISAPVEHLSSHPDIGRPGRVLGTRELVVPDTPYLIPYRVQAGHLQIIAVLHGRKQWPVKL
jgi:toxin ParE1/3/4